MKGYSNSFRMHALNGGILVTSVLLRCSQERFLERYEMRPNSQRRMLYREKSSFPAGFVRNLGSLLYD